MSDDHFVQETPKTNYAKKIGVPLAVAGVCGAAALLLAGGKTATPASTELISQQPFLNEETDMYFNPNKKDFTQDCSTNWDRLWEEDHLNFVGSNNQHRHMVDGKYEDPSFPADDSSLFWDMQTGSGAAPQVQTYKHTLAQQKGIVWVRPTEMKNNTLNPGPNKPSLYGPKGVQVRTSQQGDLGDCWFLSSATAVAEYPGRIHLIFNGMEEYNEEGAFQMNFWVRGKIVGVHIDDRIPLQNYGPGYQDQYWWINNRVSYDGAWWLVLLEKAMAKLNVNYSNINGGRPGEALRALTGAPVINYHEKDLTDDQIWNLVTEGMEQGYIMVGGTPSHPAYHVTDGHAETCLGSLILYNEDGSEHVKLIKMRNPWGKYQYDGPWSTKSDLWTPAFKKQANFAESDDGIFYTPLVDWRKEFVNLAIAHTRPWQIQSIEGNRDPYMSSQQRHEWVTITNPIWQDVMVECDQYTERLWPNTKGDTCKNEHNWPQQYQAVINTEGEHNNHTKMNTYPNNILCDGQSLKLDNLAPGQYNIVVYSFDGNDSDHGIWAMRTFGQQSNVEIRHRPNMTKQGQQ